MMLATAPQTNSEKKVTFSSKPVSLSCLTLLFLLVSIFSGITPLNVYAAGTSADARCHKCHNDIIEANLNKAYVHMPFLELQCSICHVKDAAVVKKASNNSVTTKITLTGKKIKWLDDSYSHATQHWFIIPLEQVNNNQLILSARNEMNKSHNEILQLPAIETLESKANDNRPPVITSADVLGVYSRIFISAAIGWSTDKMADSEVMYGIDSLQYSTKKDALTTRHEIVLQNLKANQKYQYAVVSRDIFGNSSVSEGGTFTTENFSPSPVRHYEEPPATDIVLDVKFFRNEDAYLVNISTNQPVILRVGNETADKAKKQTFESARVNDSEHAGMRSIDEITSKVCIKCHAKMFATGNHMVDVGPSAGMVFPANYSTDSSGHITCTTCHDPHASNLEYMTVKSRGKELCLGCHKGYNLSPGERSRPMLMAKQQSGRERTTPASSLVSLALK